MNQTTARTTRQHNFVHRSIQGEYRDRCIKAAVLFDKHGVEAHFLGERFGVDAKQAYRMVSDGREYIKHNGGGDDRE